MTTERRKLLGFSPTLFAAHLLCLIVGTHAASVLQAYRLVQYDREGVPSGSRTVRLMQYATLKKEGATLFRNVVLLPIKDATLQIVKDILDPATGVTGLIFLLPVDGPMELSGELEIFLEVERYLLLHTIAIPVYFVQYCPEINDILADIELSIANGKPPNRLNGGHLMQIKSGVVRPLKQPEIVNFEGWLHGSDGGKPGKLGVPTVVISAHYDTFAVAPGLPGSGNVSGVTALLSLLRLFSALYKNPSTRPRMNVLFLLSGGGGLDFLGLKSWLKTAHTRVIDSIEFVISLDDLSGLLTDEGLYLHYSKPPKELQVQQWYDRFKMAAEEEGLSLTSVHKKINLALPYMSWEHEHVAHQKLLGATLSGRRQAGNPMSSASILDRPSDIDREIIRRAVKLVGTAVASRLYQQDNETVPSLTALFDGLPGIGHGFLENWIRSVTTAPRMAPYLKPASPFSIAVLRFLKEHSDKGTSTAVGMGGDVVFYEGIVYELGIYKAAGFLFDLMLLLTVGLYLILLFVGLKIWTQGWVSLLTIFKSPAYKWKKASGNKGHKSMIGGKK